MFASGTLVEHLARGLAAVLAIMTAATVPAIAPAWISMPAIVLLGGSALVLLRGCPMCWTIGLVETLSGRRPSCATCAPAAGHPDRGDRRPGI